MKKGFKNLCFLFILNLLFYSIFNYSFSFSMMTGQMGVNAALANKVADLALAGWSIWGILALFSTTNIIGVGLLYAVKRMAAKNLSKAAIVAW